MIKLTPLEDLTFMNAYSDLTKKNGTKPYGIKGTANKPGVYLIKENDNLVYVGMSRSNLEKALYRHFQHWKSWRQRRVSYKSTLTEHKYTVACITTEKEAAHPTEKAYILQFNPRDNFDRYEEYSTQVEIHVNEPQENEGHVIHSHLEPAF